MQNADRNPPPFPTPEEKPDAKPFDPALNPARPSRKKLTEYLDTAERQLRKGEDIISDLNMQIQIYCISAHFRNGEVDEVTAARACNMTLDDFRRAQTVIDDQARKMLAILLQKPPEE